jgi:3-hydroxyisobutyrate dehydrogenase-like beta-hydroxyacid dehydrogenase
LGSAFEYARAGRTTQPDQQAGTVHHISIIGFGEAAQAFVNGWRGQDTTLAVQAFDVKTLGCAEVAQGKVQDYRRCHVKGVASLGDLMETADIAFSLVTADQALRVAKDAAEHITPGAFFFDGNSCAPDTKRQNAELIEAKGGHYIDMAIMAPVHPRLHKTPILISGAEAERALDILTGLGMEARIEAGPVGRASSIKMIRSIMVKGMEALMAEAMLAGRRAGVEDVVLDSLEKSWPGFDWCAHTAYNLERMMMHGERRAAEMREVVKTIDDLDLASDMSQATVEWQQVIGDLGLDAGADELGARLDRVLGGLEKGKT